MQHLEESTTESSWNVTRPRIDSAGFSLDAGFGRNSGHSSRRRAKGRIVAPCILTDSKSLQLACGILSAR